MDESEGHEQRLHFGGSLGRQAVSFEGVRPGELGFLTPAILTAV
jgi:hypothetical protein